MKKQDFIFISNPKKYKEVAEEYNHQDMIYALELVKKNKKWIRFGLTKDGYVCVYTSGYHCRQICQGGYMRGCAIKSNLNDFKKVGREWLKERQKNLGYIDLTKAW